MPEPNAHAASGQPDRAVSPWAFIITLYLPFGIIDYGLKVALPSNLFKLLEFSNQEIGLLSGIGLIASFRFAFAPWLDGATTKRRLSLVTLALGAMLAFGCAGLIYLLADRSFFLWGMVVMLFCLAIVGASHETAADGYYIRVLDPKRQAEFIGIKTAAVRAGVIFSTLVLLLTATRIAARYGATGVDSVDKTGFHIGFAAAYAVAGALILAFAVYNKFVIPRIPQDQAVRHTRFALGEVLREYFQQRGVFLMILLFLIYRVGQGFLEVMKGPFYLDPLDKGGMAADATAMPYFSLLSDMPWMIVGGIAGGYIVKWFGLRRTFIPLAIFMNLPNLFYVWLALTQPETSVLLFGETLNLGVLVGSSIESLGYGLSFSAMFYYMHIMATESGRNKTAILAVSLAVMNVGWMGPGMVSGFVQAEIGYYGLFLLSSFIGLIALLVIPFLPMPQAEQNNR
jgi:MFS transporter, PAT family, beta-lactamase induction signal transducer AmpG